MPRYLSVCLTALFVLSCTQGQPTEIAPLTGAVTGTVSSSMGGALPGVVVVITPQGASPLAPDTTGSAGTFSATIRVTTTAASGTIAVSNIPANCVAPSPASFGGLYAGGTVNVTITVTCQAQSGQVIGTITSSQGGGVANVTITATPTSTGSALPVVHTASSGSYAINNIPLGAGTVAFSTVPSSCQAPTPVSYAVPTEAAIDTINLTLTCGAAGSTGVITGTLNNSLGGTLAAVKVVVTPTGGTALPAVVSATNGSYTATGVPLAGGTGTITLSALPTGCTATPIPYTGLTAGATLTVNTTVTCAAATSTITGTITGSNNNGNLANVIVAVTPDKSAPLPTVKTNASGVYTVSNVTVSDGGGSITFANLPANCPAPTSPTTYSGLTATKSDTVNVTITCTPAVGTILGTILSSLGDVPLDSVFVTATPTGGAPAGTVENNINGSFAIPGVPAGAGTLSFTNLPINCSVPSPAPNYAQLTNGGTVTVNVVMTCTSTGGLHVFVDSTPTSGNVLVTGPNSYAQTVTATTTLANLTPGNYTVTASPVQASDPTVNATYVVRRFDPLSPISVAVYKTPVDTVFYQLLPGTGGLWIAGNGSADALDFSGPQLRAGGSVTPTSILSGSALSTPIGLALDTLGTLWVANTSGTLAGYLATLQGGGFVTPSYSDALGSVGPRSIAFDHSGNLWVADGANNAIVDYSSAQLQSGGALSATTTITSSALTAPAGIAFDASGNLWVANNATGTVLEFSASQLTAGGNVTPAVTLSATGSLMNNPDAVAFDNVGDLWVTTQAGNVLEFTPGLLSTGTQTPAITAAINGGPALAGMAFDLGGNLWVASTSTNSIIELSAAQLGTGGALTPSTTITATDNALSSPYAVLFNTPPTTLPLPQQRVAPAPQARTVVAPRRR